MILIIILIIIIISDDRFDSLSTQSPNRIYLDAHLTQMSINNTLSTHSKITTTIGYE